MEPHGPGLHDVQVFFADDEAMPGWSVVLKKEARGQRISPTGLEHSLGQEESSGDRLLFAGVGGGSREAGLGTRRLRAQQKEGGGGFGRSKSHETTDAMHLVGNIMQCKAWTGTWTAYSQFPL